MPGVDRLYFRGQARRRFLASALLVAIGLMIGIYYLSGMDARMDSIPERNHPEGLPPADNPQVEANREFARLVGLYWITIILMVGVVMVIAVFDMWATRFYWMARYREMKADHDTKLQRDLAVLRQQKLNERVKGLKPPTDDTTPEGDPPIA
jgi:hypothetical protein